MKLFYRNKKTGTLGSISYKDKLAFSKNHLNKGYEIITEEEYLKAKREKFKAKMEERVVAISSQVDSFKQKVLNLLKEDQEFREEFKKLLLE